MGKPELVDLAIQVARPRGEVLILGVSPKGTTIPSDLFETHYKELIIVNSFRQGRRVHQGYQFAGGDRPDGSDGRPISAASGGGRDDGRSQRDIEVGKDCHSAPYALIFLLRPRRGRLRTVSDAIRNTKEPDIDCSQRASWMRRHGSQTCPRLPGTSKTL